MLEYPVERVNLGGVNFPIRFQYTQTLLRYFAPFCRYKGPVDFPETVSVPPEEIAARMTDFGGESFTEFNLLLYHLCNLLLPYGRCLFHGVAFCIDGRAWLITAPSGTGKSTQYRQWKAVFGDRVRLICGDKPVLEFTRGGDVVVHPSPWRGKERWRGGAPAELAGIIYLEQGLHNEIRPMPVPEAVVPLYAQILYQPQTEEQLCQAGSMLDELLRRIPVWKLVNTGDEASVCLTYDTVCKKGGY